MKKILAILFLLLIFSHGTIAETALDEIIGTVMGFDQLGNIILEAEEADRTQYLVHGNLSMKLIDIETFSSGMRIAVTPKAIIKDMMPIEVDAETVRGLLSWPTFSGLVTDIDSDENRVQARMTDVKSVWVLLSPAQYAKSYVDRGILFNVLAEDPISFAEGEVVQALHTKVLYIYHGIIEQKGNAFGFENIIEMKSNADQSNLLPVIQLSVTDFTTGMDQLAIGNAVKALFDYETSNVYAFFAE